MGDIPWARGWAEGNWISHAQSARKNKPDFSFLSVFFLLFCFEIATPTARPESRPPFLIISSPVLHYRALSIDPDTPSSSSSIISPASPSVPPKVRPSSFPLIAAQVKTFISHLKCFPLLVSLVSFFYCLATLQRFFFCVIWRSSERTQPITPPRENRNKRDEWTVFDTKRSRHKS